MSFELAFSLAAPATCLVALRARILWPGEVVTEISEAGRFWEAGPEDQDYLQRHPDGEICHFPRPGWKLPHRETAT